MSSPKDNVAQLEIANQMQQQIEQAVAGGLGDLTLREFLSATLSSVGDAERAHYLSHSPKDKGNGHYSRDLMLGTIPLDIDVARVRSGDFRPGFLPVRYQRGYPAETQALLFGLLAASRSIGAAKASLKKMGLPYSADELDSVAREFIEGIALKNSGPVPPDLIALFIDGKYVELRDGDRLKPATIYVVIGLGRDGIKRVLSVVIAFGRENLEEWKKVLRGLIERGLRRVLILVQDDFSGLLGVTRGLFATTDIQLCVVHMQRNAISHLGKEDGNLFLGRLKEIKACWDKERASAQFDDLCQAFSAKAPAFIAELKKKRDHYLKFIEYPHEIRRSFSTTNAVETICGQLERMRRNNGGYFHSEDTLKLKLGITVNHLEQGRWQTPAATIKGILAQLNAMFERRFESEE